MPDHTNIKIYKNSSEYIFQASRLKISNNKNIFFINQNILYLSDINQHLEWNISELNDSNTLYFMDIESEIYNFTTTVKSDKNLNRKETIKNALSALLNPVQQVIDNSCNIVIDILTDIDCNEFINNIPTFFTISKSSVDKEILIDYFKEYEFKDILINKKRFTKLRNKHHFNCLLHQKTSTNNFNKPYIAKFVEAFIIESILVYIIKHVLLNFNQNKQNNISILNNVLKNTDSNDPINEIYKFFLQIIEIQHIYAKLNTAKILGMTYQETKKYTKLYSKTVTEKYYNNLRPISLNSFFACFMPNQQYLLKNYL